MTNRKLGNGFEQELCEKLSECGFWVHCMTQNKAGQPADIIAVKDKRAYLIDAKVVSSSRGFALSRVEENQDLAMEVWKSKGNGQGWFALKLNDEIYMIPHLCMTSYMARKSSLTIEDIKLLGKSLEMWVKKYASSS